MIRHVTAVFDGNVLIPSGKVDLPKGTALRIRVELETDPAGADASAACEAWVDRAELGETRDVARRRCRENQAQ